MRTAQHDKDNPTAFLTTKSGQSALEYMMTYGWAILIIVIVAVILYSMGIFNPASSISSTITGFSATPVSNAICTANGVLRIAVGDTTGHRILIKNISATSNGKTEVFTPTSTVDPNPIITSGNTYIFSVPNICPAVGTHFSASVNINYTEPTTPFPTSRYTSTGSVTGTVSSTTLPLFTAYFGGGNNNNDNINTTTQPFLNQSFTISLWVYLYNATAPSTTDSHSIFSLPGPGGCTGNSCPILALDIRSESFHYFVWDGDLYAPATAGKWYFITWVFNKTSATELAYQDGVLYDQANRYIYSHSFLFFGYIGGNSMFGFLSNVQIYNSTLTSSDISKLYNQGLLYTPLQAQQMADWWPLNGTTKDYSGNGNNGIATNVVYTSNYPATGLS